MQSAEELLDVANSLNEDEKYDKTVDLLKDDLLDKYKNVDLFVEKATAYWGLNEKKLCEVNVQKALIVEPKHSQANYLQGNLYFDEKEYEKARESYEIAIKADPGNSSINYALGLSFENLKQYKNAIKFYKRVIDLNPDHADSFSGLGNVYGALNRHKEAIECYEKAIAISPDNSDYYNNLGSIYYELNDFQSAERFYKRAIDKSQNYNASYYNLAIMYHASKDYEKALQFYNIYLNLTKASPDYFTELTQHRLIELEKLKNTDYRAISEVVDEIKGLLLFGGSCVTHYTSMTVSKALILKDGGKEKENSEVSPLRLSEGAFLNDTSEGRELFKFLPKFPVLEIGSKDAIAVLFVPKPFIGSFVTETKHDDLTLWRMYGKENKEDARGCSLTISRNGLIESLKAKLSPESSKGMAVAFEDEFKFYRVAYISYSSKDKPHFSVPDNKKNIEKNLNSLMEQLREKVDTFIVKYNNKAEIQNALKKLSEIAYLFKSAAYLYEHEVRLVVSGTGFNKIINEDGSPPRVYLELVTIPSLLKKITLGPKVEKAEEWASAFYYSLDKQGLHPEILISHLPFK